MSFAVLQQQQASGVAPPPPAGDAFGIWSPETISGILGSPLENVRSDWPAIYRELAARGMGDRPVLVAALATIGVEDGRFIPIPEYASGWEYEGRADLGNVLPGDGPLFKGRGYLQLTGRANYRSYGALLGIDLEGSPDLALDPNVAARVFALYFEIHRSADGFNMADAARAGLWRLTRILVNGGINGLSDYLGYVGALLS